MVTSNNNCPREKVSAYLDGELEFPADSQFETHLETCLPCRTELNAQRQFMCELDSALTRTPDLPIPKDFARIVSARAECDMRGVREGGERKRALLFCIALGSASFALLGATAGKSVFLSVRLLAGKVVGILSLLWSALHDSVVGLTIISRVVTRVFLPESPLATLAALIMLTLAVVWLSYQIVGYHRRHQTQLFE